MTQPTVTPYKQLRRPTDDRIVAGVCSGVGRYLGVDPVLIRVGFAVLAVITWGTALLAYPIMWFLMPEEPRAGASPPGPTPPDPSWGQPAGRARPRRPRHSHSMVPGGLLVTSRTTRLTSGTSLVMRVEIRAIRSYGRRDQSAVIASSLDTGRSTTGCP